MSSPIIVRPLETAAERHLQFYLGDQAFSHEPSEESTREWERYEMGLPEYRNDMVRGAFQDGVQVGGYILFGRTLRMGAANLLTGCIGSVVTHPDHRKKGVASALMRDAIQYAEQHGYALLLLDGIPKFYYRYGYVDMFDLSTVDVDRGAILAQSSQGYTVRLATAADSPSILALYNRHYGPYTGSFERTQEYQSYILSNRPFANPPLIALAPEGQVEGYLTVQQHANRWKAQEFTADNWAAALALLQHHAQVVAGNDAPTALRYRLPLTSPLLQWMVDHLEVTDTSHWDSPSEEWVVHTQSYHHRFAAWMARLVSLSTIMHAILPELRVRWQQALASWSGTLALTVGEETCTLHFDGQGITITTGPAVGLSALHFTPQTFVQLLFGYRPARWALQQETQSYEQDTLRVLDVLFPLGHTWLPSSDWF